MKERNTIVIIREKIISFIKKAFYMGETNKIYTIYALKFLFFVFIFVHHCFENIRIPILRQPALGVSGFIITSGFLNGYIYINKNLNIKDSLQMVKKRIKKFYLLHIIMMIVAIGYSGIFNYTTLEQYLNFFKRLICNILLIQSWINNSDYYFSFNGVTWFLSTYIFLCFMTIPCLILLKKINEKKKNNLLLILLSIILFAIITTIVHVIKVNEKPFSFEEFWIYVFPPSRMFEYLIGMIYGIIFYNQKDKAKLGKVSFSIIEIMSISILLLFMSVLKENEIANLYMANTINWWIVPLIIILIVFSNQKGIISKILSNKIFVKLGELSMYLFLIHQPLIKYIQKYNAGPISHSRLLGLYMFVATIVIAFSIKYIEDKRNIKDNYIEGK